MNVDYYGEQAPRSLRPLVAAVVVVWAALAVSVIVVLGVM